MGRDRGLFDDQNRWVPTNVLSTEHLALTRCRMSAVIHGETLHWSMRGGDDVVSAIQRNQRIQIHFYRLDHSQSLCIKLFQCYKIALESAFSEGSPRLLLMNRVNLFESEIHMCKCGYSC